MGRPILNVLQRAWLKEIGIDTRMLPHLAQVPTEVSGVPSGGNTESHDAASKAHSVVSSSAKSAASPETAQRGSSTPPRIRPAFIGMDSVVGAGGHQDTQRSTSTGHVGDPVPANAPVGTERPPLAVRLGVQPPHSLESLREAAEQCTACGLNEVRGRVVFGEGAVVSPQWMFIGEAPGEYDDSTGKPFQGRPGELLKAMLAAIGCTDFSKLYFSNVLKCRPLGSRMPEPAEVAACMPFLREQIRVLQPRNLVALGRVAASALLGINDDMESLRGRVHTYRDGELAVPVVVTHHPAALLLHGRLKADAWRDLNLLRSLPL